MVEDRERKVAKEREGARPALSEDDVARSVVDAAIEVHRALGGPGLLESVYEEALVHELTLRGLDVERQRAVPVLYKGKRVSRDLRLDIVVEGCVIVECKAVEQHNPVFIAQVLTYLRLSGLKLGLTINFGEALVKRGIHRVVNHL